jgi:hypothetical protein
MHAVARRVTYSASHCYMTRACTIRVAPLAALSAQSTRAGILRAFAPRSGAAALGLADEGGGDPMDADAP